MQKHTSQILNLNFIRSVRSSSLLTTMWGVKGETNVE
jgi:hypothetical protein